MHFLTKIHSNFSFSRLLELVDGYLINLQVKYPKSIEVCRRANGGFPLIFFLRKDAEDAMLLLLVEEIW